MTKLYERVRARIDEIHPGMSDRKASLLASDGRNADLLRKMKTPGFTGPKGINLTGLAQLLEVPVEWLLTGQGDLSSAKAGKPPEPNTRPADVQLPHRQDMPRDIPVLGTAAGGATTKGAFQITSDVIDYVARPPGLAKARDIYALYVEGDSMEPRYNPGDLVFISPHKPVRISDVVVIQEPNSNNGEPQAFIKILIRRTAEHIITRQLNPDTEVKFLNRAQSKLHKVLTMNELFGL